IIDSFKLIKFYDNNELFLFNIDEDISEDNNLALLLPDKLNQLEDALDSYLHMVKAPRWKPGVSWKNKSIELFNSYH
ncbi:MAG: hypothetical protein P8P29_05705, partial [Flavobacteriaceae bacterium]|nr:hypothetical protein [Flavobacteriaceae bacterium]